MELQAWAEAASSRICADPKGASTSANAAARWAAETVMPSKRSKVSASRPAPSPQASDRNAEFGRCAAPDTSKGEPSAAVIARFATIASSPRSTSVRSLSGRGMTFRVTSVITASVPQEPAKSLQRS